MQRFGRMRVQIHAQLRGWRGLAGGFVQQVVSQTQLERVGMAFPDREAQIQPVADRGNVFAHRQPLRRKQADQALMVFRIQTHQPGKTAGQQRRRARAAMEEFLAYKRDWHGPILACESDLASLVFSRKRVQRRGSRGGKVPAPFVATVSREEARSYNETKVSSAQHRLRQRAKPKSDLASRRKTPLTRSIA